MPRPSEEDEKLTKATLAAFLPAVEEILKQKSDIFGSEAKVNSDKLSMYPNCEIDLRPDSSKKWVIIEGKFPIESSPRFGLLADREPVGAVMVSNKCIDEGSLIRFEKEALILHEDVPQVVAYLYWQPESSSADLRGRRENLRAGARDYYLRWGPGQ